MERPAGLLPLVFSIVSRRTEMYLGATDLEPDKQLDAFQSFVCGYALAINRPDAQGSVLRDFELLGEFEAFARDRSGAGDGHAIGHIRATSVTDGEAWQRLRAIIESFRALHEPKR